MSDRRSKHSLAFDIRSFFKPLRILPIGFLALIFIGTGLLSLPVSSASGIPLSITDAMFTATSAVCVTGLSVIEAGVDLSIFGQIVLLLLIQIGGLGFVAFMTLIPLALGRRISLNHRMLIRESMNESSLGGMIRLIVWAVKMTLFCEMAGAVLLSVRFIADYGIIRGIYYAVFHSVSAFCNAGFDILGNGNSISLYVNAPLFTLAISALVIIGSTGFGVVYDIIKVRKFEKFKLHTKMVLVVSGILLAAGMVLVLIVEWNNPATLGNLSIPEKILAAFFQSVTLRTAGFYTVDQASLEPATKLVGTVMMFIGAAPASTGGGMKVTTVAILFLLTVSIMRGKRDVNAFGRRIGEDIIRRAMAIVMTGITALIVATFVVSALHPEFALIDVMYECVSAVCTVGLTAAGTANYCTVARIVFMLLMFIGRIGPMSLALAVAMRQQKTNISIRLPEDKVTVG